jgi:hypothetical protein
MSSATTRACKKIMSDTQVYSKEKMFRDFYRYLKQTILEK